MEFVMHILWTFLNEPLSKMTFHMAFLFHLTVTVLSTVGTKEHGKNVPEKNSANYK